MDYEEEVEGDIDEEATLNYEPSPPRPYPAPTRDAGDHVAKGCQREQLQREESQTWKNGRINRHFSIPRNQRSLTSLQLATKAESRMSKPVR